ncbi:MAG: MBL fold metallo-hydrolase RNA specificity domain-containing protein [Bryobacteraceae bacterium]
MQIDFTAQGIHLPEIDLWLDAQQTCANSWISHGHSDHARGMHCRVIGTSATLRIYRLRWPADNDTPQELQSLDYGQSMDFHGARLTAYPASHIVGAAQLLVEWRGERIVYTGDIKLRPPICGSSTEVIPCHRLIIESTFGLPIYRFLGREEACQRIASFAAASLAEGSTPVFIGYPLGRGQEIVFALCQAGIPVAVHGSIARMIPVYEAAGYAFPGWVPYAAKDTAGKALVVVPNFRATLEASGRNTRSAYVSGWAALDNARARAGAEELIPYSDHADFDELLAIVQQSGATEVAVVHGYTEAFANILNARGVRASAPRALAARAEEELPGA